MQAEEQVAAADEGVASPAAPTPGFRRWAAAGALLFVVSVVVPVALARAGGALGIVRNDDWSYLLTLFHWVDDGRLDFNNWVSMTLLAQLVFAAPIVVFFGHAITLIQIQTALFGFAGLLLVVWMTEKVTRRFWVGVFVAVMVAAGPMWGALAVSFMTDVPTFAFTMLTCALGIRAFARERVSLPFLGASLAAGLVAFTIRQYAAVPLVAVTLIAALQLGRERERARIRVFIGMLVAVVIAAAAFWAYWRTIPHPKLFSPEMPSGHSLRATLYKGAGLVRLVGLLVVPAIVLAGPLRIVRRSWAVAKDTTVFVSLGTVAVLAYTGFSGPNIAYAGNYVIPDGILGQGVIHGNRPPLFPPWVFPTLVVVGSVAALLLVIALVPYLESLPARVRHRDLGRHDPIAAFITLLIAGYAGAYGLASFFGIPLYDRYVLPAVPFVAMLLLRPQPAEVPAAARERAARARPVRATVAGALLALGILGGIGFLYSADSASYDGTRWKVALAATREGWKPQQVQGGFEWTNYYRRTHVQGGRTFCVRVAIDPEQGINDPRAIAHAMYRAPFRDPVPIVALQLRTACPNGPGAAGR